MNSIYDIVDIGVKFSYQCTSIFVYKIVVKIQEEEKEFQSYTTSSIHNYKAVFLLSFFLFSLCGVCINQSSLIGLLLPLCIIQICFFFLSFFFIEIIHISEFNTSLQSKLYSIFVVSYAHSFGFL